MRKQDSNENIKIIRWIFFLQIILYHHFLQNMLLLAIQRTRLKCKTAWLWLIDSYAYGCYMVLYSLYKSRLRQIKIRGCHTRCFHPFHILFTLFVLSSSATPASESSFYTYTSGPLLPFISMYVVKNEESWAKYLNLGFQALNLTFKNFLVSWNMSTTY